jgi:hypothetical protein
MTYNRKHIANSKEKTYYQTMVNHLRNGDKLNRPKTEKLANSLGINDRTLIKELTELAIVIRAREIALKPDTRFDKFNDIVELYKNQTNLSFRTSQSILLQQYSTPAPIGYLMGLYCGIDSHTKSVFEPSAGNGLLTIATKPSRVVVNEIDPVRNENLVRQNYKEVLSQDASKDFPQFSRRFDAVITNPPFGRLSKAEMYDGFPIKELDHHMALVALSKMNVNGKAAIIIGGHTNWDERGRIQKGKNWNNY